VYTRDSGGGDRWVPIDLLSAAPESNICRSHPSRVSAPGMHPSKLCSRQTMIIITAEHNTLLRKKLSRPGSPCQLCTSVNGGLTLVHIFLAYLFSAQQAFLPQPQVTFKPLRGYSCDIFLRFGVLEDIRRSPDDLKAFIAM